MHLIATAEQMRAFDRSAMTRARIPGLILMENAGRAFTDELARRIGVLEGRTVAVLCGKGNNGGDGFVIARHLANRGAEVTAYLFGRKREVAGDARVNLDAALAISAMKGASLRVVENASKRTLAPARHAAVIVDALLGTGFTGEPRGPVAEAIRWINAQDAYVASVDIPSGIDASTGEGSPTSVKAKLTVTMGLLKIGHLVGRGADCSGEVVPVDISIPPGAITAPHEPVFLVEAPDVARVLPRRPRNAHKYSAGKVLVVGGSRDFVGAPLMTAMAALRSGAGAVVLAAPRSLMPALSRRITELILLPLEETADGVIAPAAAAQLRERLDWADALAIGPGLGRGASVTEAVTAILASFPGNAVVDADALYALKGQPRLIAKRKGATVLTPHTGELGFLLAVDAGKADRERVVQSRAAAKLWKATVALKGAPTVTASPDGTRWINSTGNPGMATIGSGDVLTGLIAGIAAQGCRLPDAAWAAVFLHGLAGDRAARRRGERGLLASDILDEVPAAVMQVSPAHLHGELFPT
jgi:ADP-dependent NAD(P)H-hydrate dehydratase / NAD(P)H-hydrate epimerase